VNDQPGRPGRKRSEESRQAIIAAAVELTLEVGYAGLTIEGIAAQSGAGKQTIYRWWPSKADVLLEALATKADLHIPVPDEGTYETDLRRFLADSFELGRQPQVVDLLRALMAEAQINAEFGERFRATFLRHRRDALGAISPTPATVATCRRSRRPRPSSTSCSAPSGTGYSPPAGRSTSSSSRSWSRR
jgi:AcrR family transcriptional regulator